MLERVKANDPRAWERLVALYNPVFYHCCRQDGLAPEDAEDVVQEIFIAVARHLAGFRRDRPGDSFRSWLWTIMRSKIADHFRRRRDNPKARGGTTAQRAIGDFPDPLQASASGTDASTANRILSRRALELVQADFEKRTWQMFWRMVVDNLSAAHVAAEFGVTIHAVYKARSRVLAKLREQFGDLFE